MMTHRFEECGKKYNESCYFGGSSLNTTMCDRHRQGPETYRLGTETDIS